MKRKTVERQIKQWIKNGTLQEKLSHYVENSIHDVYTWGNFTSKFLFTIPVDLYRSTDMDYYSFTVYRMKHLEHFHNDKWFRNVLTHEYDVSVSRPFYGKSRIYYDEILEALCNRII